MPFGRLAYRLAQEHVTKSLPRPTSQFARYLAQLRAHIDALQRHNHEIDGASYVEFGAGWDLFYPIGFACAGIKTQHVYDVTELATLRYINHVICQFRELDPPFLTRSYEPIAAMSELSHLGINYHAPGDAKHTGLDRSSIDIVSTTSTLEHIPAGELVAIMTEMKRICRPGALLSMLIDYEDHYSQRDGDVSPYHFLRFEDSEWQRYNPAIHFQNRLRHCDYIRLFRDTGFALVEVEENRPAQWEQLLATTSIAKRFEHYTLADLSITGARVLLRA
jgi:SAM-dependent methyltransferase